MVIDSVIIWTLFAVPFYYISTFYVRLIVPLMFVDNSSQAQFIVHIMLVVWTVFQVSVFLSHIPLHQEIILTVIILIMIIIILIPLLQKSSRKLFFQRMSDQKQQQNKIPRTFFSTKMYLIDATILRSIKHLFLLVKF